MRIHNPTSMDLQTLWKGTALKAAQGRLNFVCTSSRRQGDAEGEEATKPDIGRQDSLQLSVPKWTTGFFPQTGYVCPSAVSSQSEESLKDPLMDSLKESSKDLSSANEYLILDRSPLITVARTGLHIRVPLSPPVSPSSGTSGRLSSANSTQNPTPTLPIHIPEFFSTDVSSNYSPGSTDSAHVSPTLAPPNASPIVCCTNSPVGRSTTSLIGPMHRAEESGKRVSAFCSNQIGQPIPGTEEREYQNEESVSSSPSFPSTRLHSFDTSASASSSFTSHFCSNSVQDREDPPSEAHLQRTPDGPACLPFREASLNTGFGESMMVCESEAPDPKTCAYRFTTAETSCRASATVFLATSPSKDVPSEGMAEASQAVTSLKSLEATEEGRLSGFREGLEAIDLSANVNREVFEVYSVKVLGALSFADSVTNEKVWKAVVIACDDALADVLEDMADVQKVLGRSLQVVWEDFQRQCSNVGALTDSISPHHIPADALQTRSAAMASISRAHSIWFFHSGSAFPLPRAGPPSDNAASAGTVHRGQVARSSPLFPREALDSWERLTRSLSEGKTTPPSLTLRDVASGGLRAKEGVSSLGRSASHRAFSTNRIEGKSSSTLGRKVTRVNAAFFEVDQRDLQDEISRLDKPQQQQQHLTGEQQQNQQQQQQQQQQERQQTVQQNLHHHSHDQYVQQQHYVEGSKPLILQSSCSPHGGSPKPTKEQYGQQGAQLLLASAPTSPVESALAVAKPSDMYAKISSPKRTPSPVTQLKRDQSLSPYHSAPLFPVVAPFDRSTHCQENQSLSPYHSAPLFPVVAPFDRSTHCQENQSRPLSSLTSPRRTPPGKPRLGLSVDCSETTGLADSESQDSPLGQRGSHRSRESSPQSRRSSFGKPPKSPSSSLRLASPDSPGSPSRFKLSSQLSFQQSSGHASQQAFQRTPQQATLAETEDYIWAMPIKLEPCSLTEKPFVPHEVPDVASFSSKEPSSADPFSRRHQSLSFDATGIPPLLSESSNSLSLPGQADSCENQGVVLVEDLYPALPVANVIRTPTLKERPKGGPSSARIHSSPNFSSSTAGNLPVTRELANPQCMQSTSAPFPYREHTQVSEITKVSERPPLESLSTSRPLLVERRGAQVETQDYIIAKVVERPLLESPLHSTQNPSSKLQGSLKRMPSALETDSMIIQGVRKDHERQSSRVGLLDESGDEPSMAMERGFFGDGRSAHGHALSTNVTVSPNEMHHVDKVSDKLVTVREVSTSSSQRLDRSCLLGQKDHGQRRFSSLPASFSKPSVRHSSLKSTFPQKYGGYSCKPPCPPPLASFEFPPIPSRMSPINNSLKASQHEKLLCELSEEGSHSSLGSSSPPTIPTRRDFFYLYPPLRAKSLPNTPRLSPELSPTDIESLPVALVLTESPRCLIQSKSEDKRRTLEGSPKFVVGHSPPSPAKVKVEEISLNSYGLCHDESSSERTVASLRHNVESIVCAPLSSDRRISRETNMSRIGSIGNDVTKLRVRPQLCIDLTSPQSGLNRPPPSPSLSPLPAHSRAQRSSSDATPFCEHESPRKIHPRLQSPRNCSLSQAGSPSLPEAAKSTRRVSFGLPPTSPRQSASLRGQLPPRFRIPISSHLPNSCPNLTPVDYDTSPRPVGSPSESPPPTSRIVHAMSAPLST
eukprot:TRINITY_DN456_c1_g1_i1.p1 TRINITY_DN456_c1_g1~~TRINITY_DN456_c1_g1_i1.p1  ORF type:complete len:1654 (-),score=203.92 TRINITY_DN456_c1_g1_i1:620-5581(-)